MFYIHSSCKNNWCPRARKLWTNFFSQVVPHKDDTIHLLRKQGIDNWNFLIIILITISKDDIVLVHFSDIINPFSKRWEIAIGNIWDHDTDSGCLFTCKTTRHGIWTVIQTINHLKHFFTGVLFYILIAIDYTANRRHWNSCFTGDIINRYCIVCIHSISFLYHTSRDSKKRDGMKISFSWFYLFHFITICKHFQAFFEDYLKKFHRKLCLWRKNHLFLIFNPICCMIREKKGGQKYGFYQYPHAVG